MEKGWVNLSRSISEKSWYSVSNDCAVFLHLFIDANFETRFFRGVEIKRGQLIRSLENLARETGLTKNQIRTSIKHLILAQEITQKTTHAGSLITLVNYDNYQVYEQKDHTGDHTEQPIQITHGSHADHTERKNKKNLTKENKNIYGEYHHVELTEKDYSELTELFGDAERDEWIRELDEYIEQKGKKYTNHLLTIKRWSRKTKNEVCNGNDKKDRQQEFDAWEREWK